MDITRMLAPGVEDFVELSADYAEFCQAVVARVRTALQWGKVYKDVPAGFEHFSDYDINPIHFDDIVPARDADADPAPESKRAVAMVVPLNQTFSVLHGPYQWPADHAHAPDQSLLNRAHPDRLSAETFAAAGGWQHHTLFVYVKRRKADNRFAAWKQRGFAHDAGSKLQSARTPLQTLRALAAAAIESEIRRCTLELGGGGPEDGI
jgi:hypothetical protein